MLYLYIWPFSRSYVHFANKIAAGLCELFSKLDEWLARNCVWVSRVWTQVSCLRAIQDSRSLHHWKLDISLSTHHSSHLLHPVLCSLKTRVICCFGKKTITICANFLVITNINSILWGACELFIEQGCLTASEPAVETQNLLHVAQSVPDVCIMHEDASVFDL